MSTVTLLTGGARSGKSFHALELAARYPKRAFVATGVASDDEMRRRIEQHRRERGGGFVTIEEPTDLAGALRRVPPECGVALVDCLTVWLGNLMHERGVDCPYPEVDAFMASLGDLPFDLILVTNEIGSGIVPTNEMAREFRDRAGRLNQQIARRADRVILLVSGIPLTIKGANPG